MPNLFGSSEGLLLSIGSRGSGVVVPDVDGTDIEAAEGRASLLQVPAQLRAIGQWMSRIDSRATGSKMKIATGRVDHP